jgi:translation initiation factor eIF-2B subunit delta
MNNSNSASDGDFRHHFDHQVLKPSFQFWTVNCRPHSVSMGNAFTFLKTAVASLDRDISLEDAKLELEETIERYLQERLEYADRAIAQHALTKIHDGDILLTFGYTEAIDVLLRTAQEERIDFYVWVVDARPLTEGKRLLQNLREVGIPCGYIQLNALTYVMQQVTKVFLGASALLVNGSIYGRIGTACVALLAKSHHVPVLVCSETYKISNKVQLESITQNELGNPYDLLLENSKKANGQPDDDKTKSSKPKNLKAANLLYDVTPDKFVSGIITELGIIPPTSVAVLLREMNLANDRAY